MAYGTVSSATAIPVESSKPALHWGPVIGGAVAASATSLILILVGSGVGLTMVSPWSGQSSSLMTIGATAAIWLIVVQWLSAAIGGYLTGRLRTKWAGVHTNEVFFRDTAHGFLSWALATVLAAGILGSALSSVANTGAQAAGAAIGAAGSTAASAAASSDNQSGAMAYFTDSLLRPADGRNRPNGGDAAAAGEVSRILLNGVAHDQMPDDDKAYLVRLVASNSGLSDADAKARVDAVLKQIDDAKIAAKKAADTARKAAATTALIGSLSLLVGAFIASAAAALGGSQRDEDEDVMLVR